MKRLILYFIWIILLVITLCYTCSCNNNEDPVIYESSLDEISIEYKEGKYYINVNNKQIVTSNYKIVIDIDQEIIVYDYSNDNYDKVEFHITGGFNE